MNTSYVSVKSPRPFEGTAKKNPPLMVSPLQGMDSFILQKQKTEWRWGESIKALSTRLQG
jgi:hypothetical protein